MPMALSSTERVRRHRQRKRSKMLATREQVRSASDGLIRDYIVQAGNARTGVQAACQVAVRALRAAHAMTQPGPDGRLPDAETCQEACRRADVALELLVRGRAHLPAPAADPPPLSIALPRYPEESDADYEALLEWYRSGQRTDPPAGNLDWVSRAVMASAYTAMDEGTESVGIGARLGLPASTLAGHALYARLGRDKLAAVSKVTGEPVE